MTLLRSITLAIFLVLHSHAALAWGVEGHQIIADIAEAQLEPSAKQRISEILQGERMRDVANYADEIRPRRRDTSRWHFVNIAPDATNYDEARDCQQIAGQGDCIIKEIDRALADIRTGGDRQREGLKFLIHFVGDLHQPFHAVTEARGGNDIAVTFMGVSSNLHRVWDTDMLVHLLRSRDRLPAVRSGTRAEALAALSKQGGIVEWALQSRAIGVTALVPSGTAIDVEYVDKFMLPVEQQLVLAGLRLAHLLNEAFR